jgi:hypothetical protein
LDFEEALADGFTKVFPNASVMRDFFHFMQANVKKVLQLGMKSCMHDVVTGLRCLWHKPTKSNFDTYLNEFIDEWERKAPQYLSYFRSTWLNRYMPAEWASYARASNARSGTAFFFFFFFFLKIMY